MVLGVIAASLMLAGPLSSVQAMAPNVPGADPVRDRAALATVTIDGTRPRQTIEGFGATHPSLVYEGRGDSLSPSLRKQAIEAAYGLVRLTTGNVEGALLESPGGYDARANDDNDPNSINWNGFNPLAAQNAKRYLIDPAVAHGFDNFYLAQKVNVRWASPWLTNLRATDYGRYLDEIAEQIVAGHLYWRDRLGVTPRYAMLFNEPLSGNRELLEGGPNDVKAIVIRVGARLRAQGFAEIKFVLPNEETEEKTLATAEIVLADAEARQYIAAIGYHTYPYGSTYSYIPSILGTSGNGRPDPSRLAIRARLRDLARQHGVAVWMTEVSHGGVDPRSFDSLRGRAIHIHDELTYADAAAYYGMMALWDMTSHQEHFNNRTLFGGDQEGNIVFIENDSATVTIAGIGYAIGHYARWLKRGAVRLETNSGDPLVLISAFRDDGQGRLVAVIVNNAASEQPISAVANGLSLGGSLAGEQSTASAAWQPLPAGGVVTAGGFSLTVPALSVTSLSIPLTGTPPGGPPVPPAPPAPPPPNVQPTDERCFSETNQCITGRFRQYWEQNGGVSVFGYPIGPARQEINRDTGLHHLTQWFERNRLELHPQKQPPYDVQLGRLGDERARAQGIDWTTLPPDSGAQSGCLWFPETRRNVCDQGGQRGFRSYWMTHGLNDPALDQRARAVALFGLPLTEARQETNAAGDTVLTQWFERARFEWHPAKPDEFKVLLGLLGQELATASSASGRQQPLEI